MGQPSPWEPLGWMPEGIDGVEDSKRNYKGSWWI